MYRNVDENNPDMAMVKDVPRSLETGHQSSLISPCELFVRLQTTTAQYSQLTMTY